MKKYNFDHPEALDFQLIEKCLKSLIKGESIPVPLYDFKTNARCGETLMLPRSVILFEGILAFYQEVQIFLMIASTKINGPKNFCQYR